MYKYLIKSDDELCLFYSKPYEGICMKKSKPGGWSSDINICQEASENFYVYQDKSDIIHLWAITKENKLIYMICKNNEWKKFNITTINKEFNVKKIMISETDIGENLFFSAKFHDEYILVHCVLGNNAMPSTTDKLYDGDFFVYKNKIYYQNSDNTIGYRSFSDGKPDNFIKICDGEMPYFTVIDTKNYLVYKKSAGIYVNETLIANDTNALNPIVIKKNNKILVMWQSNDMVKYRDITESSAPVTVRTIATGIRPSLYMLTSPEKCNCLFGAFSGNKLSLFPDINPFAINNDLKLESICEKKDAEIQWLKKQLEKQKENVKKYRSEIKKLNEIIFNMKEKQE